MGRDLERTVAALHADRPEPLALCPHCIGPTGHDSLGLLGTRVRGEVDVGLVDRTSRQEIAHDAADQVHLLAGRGEALGQWPRLVEDRSQILLDHSTVKVAAPSGPLSRLVGG
jgi:hypothetical protein